MDSAGKSDPAFASSMREMSRAHYADIWRRGQSGEVLVGEDESFFQAMRQHPEYTDCWERAAELADREIIVDGVNPYLHIAMHSVIERQIADRDPPETDQALFRLTRGGIERHESLHRIARVFSDLMWTVMRERRPFDTAKYRRRLRALKP
jgi:hypothetical protein